MSSAPKSNAACGPVEQHFSKGLTLQRGYNAAGYLARIEVDRDGTGYAEVVTDLRTNARGQLTRLTHGNGVVTAREHDPDLERLVRIYTSHDDGTLTEFQDLSYAYDPVGNPVAITDNLASSSYKANTIIPNTRAFEYDPRYRLIRATGKKHASVVPRADDIEVPSPDPNDYDAYDYTYSYDPVGNLTRNDEYASSLNYKSGRIDLFNGDSTEAGSFTDPATGNFRYDENGNTLKTPRLVALAYTHDDPSRWVKLNSGGDAVRYFRHADQRVLRFVSKGRVRVLSVYLGPFEYHHRAGGSVEYGKVVLHVHGHGRHAQVEHVLDGSDPDSLDIFYHHGDHLGSGHVLTKDDATLMSQEEYLPYGRSSDRRDARNRYRFIGVERDEETGMCMTGPRQYDPVMGRFLEGDPLAVGSSTPFDYGGGSPVGWKDPGGYQEQAAAPSEVVIVRSITEDEVASAYAPALEAINDSQKAGDMGLSSTDVEAIAKGVEGLKAAARDGKAKVDPSHQAFWDVDVSGNRVRNQTGGVMDSKTGEITLYSFPHEPSNDPIIEQDPGIHEGTHYNQWKADPVGFAKAYEVGGNTSVETVNNAMDKVRIEAEADRAGVAGGHVMSALAKGRMSKLEPLKNPSGFGSAKGAYDAWKARFDGLGLEATLILEMQEFMFQPGKPRPIWSIP